MAKNTKLLPEPAVKNKRSKKRARTTLVRKDHPEGSSNAVGHEERLAHYILRTLELKRKGYRLFQIAEMIATEFNLTHVPHIATVHNWSVTGMKEVNHDILQLQLELRINQFNELEKLKDKWMPIACADQLKIQRWKMEEGTLQPFMDENATAEQLKATNELVKIMARQAKLLGLDMEKAVTKDGEGPANLQELQIWLINHHPAPTQSTVHGSTGGTIDIHSEVLSTRTGIPELEQSSDSI